MPARLKPTILASLSKHQRASFSNSVARHATPFFQLTARANAQETQHFLRASKLSVVNHSPNLELLKSSEVDPFKSKSPQKKAVKEVIGVLPTNPKTNAATTQMSHSPATSPLSSIDAVRSSAADPTGGPLAQSRLESDASKIKHLEDTVSELKATIYEMKTKSRPADRRSRLETMIMILTACASLFIADRFSDYYRRQSSLQSLPTSPETAASRVSNSPSLPTPPGTPELKITSSPSIPTPPATPVFRGTSSPPASETVESLPAKERSWLSSLLWA